MEISNETISLKEVAEKIFETQYDAHKGEVAEALPFDKFKA
jgi:hypothetical protein